MWVPPGVWEGEREGRLTHPRRRSPPGQEAGADATCQCRCHASHAESLTPSPRRLPSFVAAFRYFVGVDCELEQ